MISSQDVRSVNVYLLALVLSHGVSALFARQFFVAINTFALVLVITDSSTQRKRCFKLVSKLAFPHTLKRNVLLLKIGPSVQNRVGGGPGSAP